MKEPWVKGFKLFLPRREKSDIIAMVMVNPGIIFADIIDQHTENTMKKIDSIQPAAPGRPRSVNVYELMHYFWQENDYEPFSTAAIALYAFLMNRANSRRWQMPLKCATSVIARAIGVTPKTVIAARKSLVARNLITCMKGSGRTAVPNYSLILTHGVNEEVNDGVNDTVNDAVNDEVTGEVNPLNIKDKKSKIQHKKYLYKKSGEESVLSLQELEELLGKDTAWLNDIITMLSPTFPADGTLLKTYLGNFFRFLRCQGLKERRESECRQHFVNWLFKQKISKSNGTAQQSAVDLRRPSAVTAESADGYEGMF